MEVCTCLRDANMEVACTVCMPLVKCFQVTISKVITLLLAFQHNNTLSSSMLLFHNGNRTEPSPIQSVIILNSMSGKDEPNRALLLQAGAILPTRDYSLCATTKISPKAKY